VVLAGSVQRCRDRPAHRGWLGGEDLEAEAAQLPDRGVAFGDDDLPGLRTVDGVASTPVGKAAWFKDSEAICSG